MGYGVKSATIASYFGSHPTSHRITSVPITAYNGSHRKGELYKSVLIFYWIILSTRLYGLWVPCDGEVANCTGEKICKCVICSSNAQLLTKCHDSEFHGKCSIRRIKLARRSS